MTHTDYQEPVWQQELERLLRVKTVILLHGNVNDFVPYRIPNGDRPPGSRTWVFRWLDEFLPEFLMHRGYERIGVYDIVDGLRFPGQRELRGLNSKDPNLQHGGHRFHSEQPSTLSAESSVNQSRPVEILAEIRATLANSGDAVAFIIRYAPLLSGSGPDDLEEDERRIFLLIAKCAREARIAKSGLNNVLLLVADNLQRLPPWLYLEQPLVQTLVVPRPDEAQRRLFFHANWEALCWREPVPTSEPESLRTLASLTHGFMTRELEALVQISRNESIQADDGRKLVERFKFGVRESPWEDLRDKLATAEKELQKRVKGQPAAIRAVTDILKRAALGLSGVLHSSQNNKPKGVMFFAGPTGVGKTELAKSLAELLFGDESACLRFDMSEYSQPHSDQRLFGAPPGYVGYEAGGQLTGLVKQSPFSVLLFDEIDKADRSILDKFLQILEDGRLTSGQGETVYFSECLIIFTSNKGMYAEDGDVSESEHGMSSSGPMMAEKSRARSGQQKRVLIEPGIPYPELEDKIMKALHKFFESDLERPELKNRIGDNFVIFDFIRPEILGEIIRVRLASVAQALADRHGWEADFTAIESTVAAEARKELAEYGARGVANLLEKQLVNPLARRLFDENPPPGQLAVTGIRASEVGGSTAYEVEWTWNNKTSSLIA